MSSLPAVAQPAGDQTPEDFQPLAQETPAELNCSLVERSEVVWTVAWVAVALSFLGLFSTARIWSDSTGSDLSEPPRFSTDINSAPVAELALLPGIGPRLAARIVAERESSGPFASAQQLGRVHGIGRKTIEQVTPLVICGDQSLQSPAISIPNQLADTP